MAIAIAAIPVLPPMVNASPLYCNSITVHSILAGCDVIFVPNKKYIHNIIIMTIIIADHKTTFVVQVERCVRYVCDCVCESDNNFERNVVGPGYLAVWFIFRSEGHRPKFKVEILHAN